MLIVEDSDEDYYTTARALRASGVALTLQRCRDGREVIALLETGLDADLVLLDLNLPGVDGRELIRAIREHAVFWALPIVVLSTSNHPSDVNLCYRRGVNSYLVKPVELATFMSMMTRVATYWVHVITLRRAEAV